MRASQEMNVHKASSTAAAFLAAKFKVNEDEIPTPNDAESEILCARVCCVCVCVVCVP